MAQSTTSPPGDPPPDPSQALVDINSDEYIRAKQALELLGQSGVTLSFGDLEINTIEELAHHYSELGSDDEKWDVLEDLYDQIKDMYAKLDTATDPWIIALARCMEQHGDAEQQRQARGFEGFVDRHQAASARRDRRQGLENAITKQWGARYLNHPYVVHATSDDSCKLLTKLVKQHPDEPQAVWSRISRAIVDRFKTKGTQKTKLLTTQDYRKASDSTASHALLHDDDIDSAEAEITKRQRINANEPRYMRELPSPEGTYLVGFTTGDTAALSKIQNKVVDHSRSLLTAAPTGRESGFFEDDATPGGSLGPPRSDAPDTGEEQSPPPPPPRSSPPAAMIDPDNRAAVRDFQARRSARNRTKTSYLPVGATEEDEEEEEEEEGDDVEGGAGEEEQDSQGDASSSSSSKRARTGRAVARSTPGAIVSGTNLPCTCADDVDKLVLGRISAIAHLEIDPVGRRQEYNLLMVDACAELNAGRDICFNHLKILMQKAGYYIREKTHDKLRDCLATYALHVSNNTLDQYLQSDEAANEIKKHGRPAHKRDVLGVMKHEVVEGQADAIGTTITDELASRMLDLIDPRLKPLWEEDQDIIVDIFAYWEEAGLMQFLREEVRMYDHHFRLPLSERKHLGWLRNCFHSIAQQCMRADPLYYIMYVALRPDHAVQLISYPYYVKHTHEGDRTKFRHIDLNLNSVVNQGQMTSAIQGSVSLTDEDAENCTVMLPGMTLDKMRLWHQRMQEREASAGKPGTLLREGHVNAITDKHWTNDDAKALGLSWRKDVCKAGDARISSPLLPHGSTGPATKDRITMLPWFVKVGALRELEHPDAGTENDLVTSHIKMIPGPRTPSGHPIMFTVLKETFPAAVRASFDHPICRALQGLESWGSPGVQDAKAKLFSGEDTTLRKSVRQIRKRIVQGAVEALRQMKSIEERKFGANSYFATKYSDTAGAVEAPGEEADDSLLSNMEAEEDEIDDSELEGGEVIEKLLAGVNDKNMPVIGKGKRIALSKAFTPAVRIGAASGFDGNVEIITGPWVMSTGENVVSEGSSGRGSNDDDD